MCIDQQTVKCRRNSLWLLMLLNDATRRALKRRANIIIIFRLKFIICFVIKITLHYKQSLLLHSDVNPLQYKTSTLPYFIKAILFIRVQSLRVPSSIYLLINNFRTYFSYLTQLFYISFPLTCMYSFVFFRLYPEKCHRVMV